jgi:hypothetical protein
LLNGTVVPSGGQVEDRETAVADGVRAVEEVEVAVSYPGVGVVEHPTSMTNANSAKTRITKPPGPSLRNQRIRRESHAKGVDEAKALKDLSKGR